MRIVQESFVCSKPILAVASLVRSLLFDNYLKPLCTYDDSSERDFTNHKEAHIWRNLKSVLSQAVKY